MLTSTGTSRHDDGLNMNNIHIYPTLNRRDSQRTECLQLEKTIINFQNYDNIG